VATPGRAAKAGHPMNNRTGGRGTWNTTFHDLLGPWYSLDNAASIMPSTSDSTSTHLFGLAVTFRDEVDRAVLRQALDATVARFPYFAVELRRGLFWPYLVPHKGIVPIEEDISSAPLIDYDVNRRGRCLFRVRVGGKRVLCEFHHAIADGTGGMRFLKNLVVEYLRLAGRAPAGAMRGSADLTAGDPDIYDLDSLPAPDESEDAYDRHADPGLPSPEQPPQAWSPRRSFLGKHRYRITCGIVPLDEARAKARGLGVSITELLVATYMDALQELWLRAGPARQRLQRPTIVIDIPVNLRQHFPSGTNRNFSLTAQVRQDMRLRRRDFEDMATRAHHEFRNANDARAFGRQIARNVGASRSLAFRLIPFPLKEVLYRFLFRFFGSSIYSGSISNLGAAALPAWAVEHVERFDFLPSPYVNKSDIGVLSWKGLLHISLGSMDGSRELERLFFTRLRRLGLHVRLECNLGEGDAPAPRPTAPSAPSALSAPTEASAPAATRAPRKD